MPAEKAPPRSKALVDTLTDSAALPALVARLDAPALKRLVDDVGLADAGPLVEHASAQQMRHLIDESVWRSAAPGAPESLDMHALLRWFEVMLDIGESFAAQKLIDLGSDFCAMTLAKLITVNGSEDDLGEEFSMVIGVYFVAARYADEWDVLQATLTDLWDEDPDFLEAVLGRLAFRHSVLGIEGENDAARMLELDAAHEWASEKSRRGFVVAVDAAGFLNRIVAADIDELADEQTYDLATAQYFEQQAQDADQDADGRGQASAAGSMASGADEDDDLEDMDLDGAEDEAELDRLQQEFERYESKRAQQQQLLTGPGGRDERLPLRRALAALSADPEVMEARTRELSYLSNLVITGCPLDGQSLDETAAANFIMATCNLGAAYLDWLEHGSLEQSDAALTGWIRAEPGLVRLFRLGWKLLSQIPLQVAGALRRHLLDVRSTTRLGLPGWLLAEVDTLLTEPDLVTLIRDGAFAEVKETIEILRMVFAPGAIAGMCVLVDPIPRYSTALDAPDAELEDGEEYDWRYLSSMQDLQAVNGVLNGLNRLVNV